MSREEMACHAEGRNAALRRVQEGRGESRAGTEAARRYLKFFFFPRIGYYSCVHSPSIIQQCHHSTHFRCRVSESTVDSWGNDENSWSEC